MKKESNPHALSLYDYPLPEGRIAQFPMEKRDRSRLLTLGRFSGKTQHGLFRDLGEKLLPGDLMVVNDTRVIRGRLHGKKDTGGKVEVLLLDYAKGAVNLHGGGDFICDCLVRASKAPKEGSRLIFSDTESATVLSGENGVYTLCFSAPDMESLLESRGEVPLPPYIVRDRRQASDEARYQTLYAREKGAVAAPTAGLHFSGELLESLEKKGVERVSVTLHVGYGSFAPLRNEDVREHVLHEEWCRVPEKTAKAVNLAKREGRRVVAVGTTSTRALEHAADSEGRVREVSGPCGLFIYPGFRFRVVDALITNFHLPRSSLLLLVSAFCGRENLFSAYEEAIEREYRFYSYGDAMFIR